MRLDHISYVASHDQISDVVNRIGSQIETAFVDGGIHPKFGTRNFTAPLQNGQYIEIVCPLNHPATDETPFGRLVKQKEQQGGGWLTWVFSTDNISNIESIISRQSVIGLRKKPNGDELKWKQIGLLSTLKNAECPYFIEWLTSKHPSHDGIPKAAIKNIEISGNKQGLIPWSSRSIDDFLGGVSVKCVNDNNKEYTNGILKIDFEFNSKIISID